MNNTHINPISHTKNNILHLWDTINDIGFIFVCLGSLIGSSNDGDIGIEFLTSGTLLV
jgi:hypothetical protein